MSNDTVSLTAASHCLFPAVAALWLQHLDTRSYLTAVRVCHGWRAGGRTACAWSSPVAVGSAAGPGPSSSSHANSDTTDADTLTERLRHARHLIDSMRDVTRTSAASSWHTRDYRPTARPMRIASEANGEQFSLAQASRSGWHHARDVRIHSTSADAEERATFARRICAQLAGTSADEDTTAAVTGINKRIEMRQIESLTLEGCESLTPDLLDSLLGLVAPTLTVLVSDSIAIVMRPAMVLLADRLRVLAVPALSPKLLAQMHALESLELLGSADETLDVPVSLFLAIRRLTHAHHLRALTVRRLHLTGPELEALYAAEVYTPVPNAGPDRNTPAGFMRQDLKGVPPAQLTHLRWLAATSSHDFDKYSASEAFRRCTDYLPHLRSVELTHSPGWEGPVFGESRLTRCTHVHLALLGPRSGKLSHVFQATSGAQVRVLSLVGYEFLADMPCKEHATYSIVPFEQMPMLEEFTWLLAPVDRTIMHAEAVGQTRSTTRLEHDLWPAMMRDLTPHHCPNLRRMALGPCAPKFKLTKEGAKKLAKLPRFERLILYSEYGATAPMQFTIQGAAMKTIASESATWRTIELSDAYRSGESTAAVDAWLKQPHVMLPMTSVCTGPIGAIQLASAAACASSTSESFDVNDEPGTVVESSAAYLHRLTRFRVRRHDEAYAVRLSAEVGDVNGLATYRGQWST